MIPRVTLLVFALLGLVPASLLAQGQGVTVQAALDRAEAQVGEEVQLQVTITSSGEQLAIRPPSVPDVEGLNIQPGGTSQHYNSINGQITIFYTHTFTILSQRSGTFTIPAIPVEVNGQETRTRPLTLTVRDHPGASGKSTGGGSSSGGDQNLLLRVDLPRDRAYVGEALLYEAILLTRYQLAQWPQAQGGQFKGFTVENLKTAEGLGRVPVDGVPYQAAEISRKILIPSQVGALKVVPEVVQVPLRAQGRRQSFGGFDDDFFQGGMLGDLFTRVVTRTVTAAPIVINVLPLPAPGRPANFSGVVGKKFTMSLGVDAPRISQSDVFPLKLVIRGVGDARSVAAPAIPVEEDFKVFPAKASSRVEFKEDELITEKTFEIILGPRKTGDLVIPPIHFSYFDVEKNLYVDCKTEPARVRVTPGEKEQMLASENLPRREKLDVIGDDLQYIKENPDGIAPETAAYHRTGAFLGLSVVPLMLLGLAHAFRIRRDRFEGDHALVRRTRAYKTATGALRELSTSRGSLTGRDFYERLADILFGYTADKLDLPAAGMVLDQLEAQFAGRDVLPKLIQDLKDLLTRAEMARFAPAEALGDPDGEITLARSLVDGLEESL